MLTSLVTGSASGIGAATAAQLRAAGHRVIGIDRSGADIDADLSSAAGRRAAIDAAIQHCEGRLDRLVLCAGLGPHVSPASLTVSVNYFGAIELLDGLLPALQKGTQPAAVVVSSVVSGMLPWSDNPLAAALAAGDEAQAQAMVMASGAEGGDLAYTGSKNAVTVAVRQRVSLWGQAGVRLNTVAPGATQTALLQAGLDDPRVGDSIRAFVAPLGRVGNAQEVASAIVFLLGPDASYVHGAQLAVDGGSDALIRATQF